MRRHIDLGPRSDRILAPPIARHRLGLRVKVDAGLAVKRTRAAARDRLLVTGEGEHGERDGDWSVRAC